MAVWQRGDILKILLSPNGQIEIDNSNDNNGMNMHNAIEHQIAKNNDDRNNTSLASKQALEEIAQQIMNMNNARQPQNELSPEEYIALTNRLPQNELSSNNGGNLMINRETRTMPYYSNSASEEEQQNMIEQRTEKEPNTSAYNLIGDYLQGVKDYQPG